MIINIHSKLCKPFVKTYLMKLSKKTNSVLHTTNCIKSIESTTQKKKRKSSINDSLRFTIEVTNVNQYVDVCYYFTKNLDVFKVTNHWKRCNKAYNGYHIYAKTNTQLSYEVQVHTTKSKKWRDDHRSRLLYDFSKIALDYNYNTIYLTCQFLLYVLTIELQYELLIINFFFQAFNSFH